jgi:transposase
MLPIPHTGSSGRNSKLHAVVNGDGKPLMLMLTEGQMSDHTGAKILYPALPPAKTLIADKGYDSDAFRDALADKNIEPCIPPKTIASSNSPMTKASTSCATGSKTCLANSRTGAASQPATTAAHTSSSRQSRIAAIFIFYLNQ